MIKVKQPLPHRVTFRVSDREKKFLESCDKPSEVLRKALMLYMTQAFKDQLLRKGK